MPALPPVAIAGAGIAGLAAALSLARKGLASIVLERRPELSEAGAGIQIGPNGMRVLQALGVADALAPLAGKPQSIVISSGASGRVLAEMPLGSFMTERYGAPYWVAHRADLQRVLAAKVDAAGNGLIELRTGHEVTGWQDSEGRLTVDIAGHEPIPARALIGADGIWSAVRRRMFPAAGLHYAGKMAARCVIPATLAEGRIAAAKTGVWLGHDAHVVHYPVSGGAAIAVVAIIDEITERPRRWGTDIPRDHVLARLEPFARELRHFAGHGKGWQAWSLYDPTPLLSWSQGAVVLIGDAAHPILPFLAQGGVLALEDAVMLAARLAAAPHDIPATFKAFEHSRRDRVARVQNAARTNGRIYHMRGLSEIARDSALAFVPPKRLMAGLDWLYGWTGDPGFPCE